MILHTNHLFHTTRIFLLLLCMSVAGVIAATAQNTINSRQQLQINYQSGVFVQDTTPPVAPFLYVFRSEGTTYSHAQLTGSNPISNYTITPNVDVLLNAACTDRKVKKAELLLRLDLGETYEWVEGTPDFAVNLEFTVEAYRANHTKIPSFAVNTPVTLSLNKQEPEKVLVIDYTILHEYSQVSTAPDFVAYFKIAKLSYSCPNSTAAILNKIRFWVGDRLEIVSKAKEGILPYGEMVHVQKVANHVWENPVTLHWTSDCKFPNYQVQILRLYNIDDDELHLKDETKVTAKIDWNKALTIETESPETELTLTLAEGTGYYVWRVRPIGDFYEGGIANDDNWGTWSDESDWQTIASGGQQQTFTSPAGAPDYAFFYHQFDDDKNWIYQRSFSENQHINEQMVYANGLNQTKQTQVRLPSKEAVLASQTVYDFAGRPSLTSLSAPLKNSDGSLRSVLSYQKGVLQEDNPLNQPGGVLYSARSFDDDPYNAKPVKLGDVTTYYSDDNPDKTIPVADEYPYSRTVYYADGTSRPREVSTPGGSHRLTTATGSSRHTTRYSYATPSDDELIAIFGHEAPAASSVQKVTTWDPNNIASVQYISKEGKTLATCLVKTTGGSNLALLPEKNTVGDPNDEFPLGNEDKEEAFNKRVSDTIRAGTRMGQYGHLSSKNISLGGEQAITIKYKIIPETLEFSCGDQKWCAVGDYEVDLRLRNVEDPTQSYSLPTTQSHHIDVEGGAVACSMIGNPQPDATYTTVTASLPPGTYAVERRLKVNTLYDVYNDGTTKVPYLDWYLNKVRQDAKTAFDEKLVPIYTALNVSIPEDPIAEQQALKEAIDDLYAQYPDRNIDAGCCNLTLPPKEDCNYEACSDVVRTESGKLDFEKILFDRWASLGEPKTKRWSNGQETYSRNVSDYFFTNKTQSTHTIMSNGDFNTLVHNMISSGHYNCAQLVNCWRALVESFESMATVQENSTSAPHKSQNFDLLESFLRCTGTVYGEDGINPLITNPGDYSSIVLNAYKYFYYPEPSDRVEGCIRIVGVPPQQDPVQWARQGDEYKWEEFYFCVTERELYDIPEPDEQNIITECVARCEDRLGGFVQEVQRAYHEAGKVIDNDPEAATQKPDITMNEILCIASRMVNKCKEDCNSSNSEDVMKALSYEATVHVPRTPNETCDIDYIKLNAPASYVDNTLAPFVLKLNQALTQFKQNPAFADLAYEENWHPYYLEIASIENMGINCCGNPNMTIRGGWTQHFTLYPPNGGSNLHLVTEKTDPYEVVEEFICDLGVTCAPICFAWVEPISVADRNSEVDPVNFRRRTCERDFAEYILTVLAQQRSECMEEQVQNFAQQYQEKLNPSTQDEEFIVEYNINQYHYTLYYYDRAGNLVQTVPPRGVDILENGTSTFSPNRLYDEPAHSFKTMYKNNSLAQVVEQETPDGGTAILVYDSKGRVRFSRSAQQKIDHRLSYTKYDVLGRILEVGETGDNLIGGTNFNSVVARQNADMWVTPFGGTPDQQPFSDKIEITRTVYTEPQTILYNGQSKEQRYLRNRISMTRTDIDGNETTTNDQTTTYYSYDPHGNVEWVVQELPILGRKFVRYEYDLISNKPTAIHYNEGMVDQFHHRYSYDDENRLILVETSRDGQVWDRDAEYEDYLHGSMKRVLIGEDMVQGLDYVYTVQGWLKGINHPSFENGATATRQYDPGLDGEQTVAGGTAVNKNVARDAFGMILGYYEGDFNRTDSPFNSYDQTNAFHLQGSDLYNGNISSWTANQEYTGQNGRENKWTGETYAYDHLNRLLHSRYHERSGSSWSGLTFYNTDYRYDPNGNIMRLRREAKAGRIDDLTYHYQPNNNRLSHVNDIQGANLYPDEEIGNQDPNNYVYDDDGNLTSDDQEKISVVWNTYGKIATVTKKGSNNTIIQTIVYFYDAQGNRVLKEVHSGDINAPKAITWYVRAADGNVLAVYTKAGITGPIMTGENQEQQSIVRNAPPMAMVGEGGGGTGIDTPDPDDMDGDGIKDIDDPDRDGDGVLNGSDQCPDTYNPNQIDSNGDGCDDSQTGGGGAPTPDDIDGDGIKNSNDPDRDDDGVPNEIDQCPDTYNPGQTDTNHDGCEDEQGGGTGGDIQLAELHIYGRSRLGMMKPEGVTMALEENRVSHNVDVGLEEHNSVYVRRVNRKQYELVDHLGNVRVVITDVKTTSEPLANDKPQGPYKATLLASNNYYPFGMLQPERHWSTEEYRYGYNGKEMDNETKGEGNSYDYGARIYDPRIARFLSIDPAIAMFPMLSSYLYADNSPITNADIQGLWAWVANYNIEKGYLEFVHSNSIKRIVSHREINTLEIQKKINGLYHVWNDPSQRHYAPSIANFLKSTPLTIAITETEDNVEARREGGLTDEIGGRMIAIHKHILDAPSARHNLEKVAFHELIHGMGHDEFGAHAAELAAGYISTSDVKNAYNSQTKEYTSHNDPYWDYEYRQYFFRGMPEDIKKEFFGENAETKNYTFKEGKSFEDFLVAMYNYGKTITGQDGKSN